MQNEINLSGCHIKMLISIAEQGLFVSHLQEVSSFQTKLFSTPLHGISVGALCGGGVERMTVFFSNIMYFSTHKV